MVIQFQSGADDGMPAIAHPGRFPFDRARSSDPSQPFDRQQLQQFREALAEQHRFRLEQLAELDTAGSAGPHQLGEVTAALRIAANAALSGIDAALGRLRNDSYGRCVRCQRPILVERLEILPAAALCMQCQHASESPAR
jgi:DnaK suppressor protein